MTKVDTGEGYVREPKWTPEDLEEEAAVLTVAKYEQFKKKDGPGMVRKLVFQDDPEKVHFLNLTQTKYLVEVYGDDTDQWLGKPVPIVVNHGADLQGKRVTNLWVAAPESWNEIFRAAGIPELKTLRPKVGKAGTVTTAAKQAKPGKKKVALKKGRR